MDYQREKSKKSLVKKISYGVLGVFGVLVLLLIVPFLIDFSSFKPQIQGIVEEHVNAKIDFASARLQLFPSIGIKVKGVVLENTDEVFNGTKMFAVESLLIEAKLMPLLGGRVIGNVRISAPEFTLAKSGIKTNVTALMKPSPATKTSDTGNTPGNSTPPQTTPTQNPEAGNTNNSINTLKEKLLIEGIYVEHANITIRNLASETKEAQEPVRIRDLNIAITNLGLDRDIQIKMDTDVDVHEAGAIVKGKITVDKIVHVNLNDKGLEKATFSGKLSYDELLISYQDVFKKNSGIPLNVSFSGVFVPDNFILDSLLFRFHNLNVNAKANVANFADPKIQAEANISNENLASLGDVLPKHKDMLLNGKLVLLSNFKGSPSDLKNFDAHVDFNTVLSGTDLSLKLNAKGLFPFNGKVDVKSQKIDVDRLISPFVKNSKESPSPTPSPSAGSPGPAETKTADQGNKTKESEQPAKDFALTEEQKKLIRGTDAEIRVDLKEIVYSKMTLTNFKIDIDQKNLKAFLRQFNIDGFGGKISSTAQLDLEQSPIPFDGSFRLFGIHPEQVLLVVKPEHKDLLVGKMNLELAAKGAGTTVPTLNKTLNGQGTFKFLDGELHTASIASLMGEELDKAITGLSVSNAGKSFFDAAEKILNSPLAKAAGKNPPDIGKMKEQYQSVAKLKVVDKAATNRSLKDVSGKIEIKNGKTFITSLISEPFGTLDVKSWFDLEMNLGGTTVYTASDATKSKLKSQSPYADLILDDKGALIIPLKLSGTVKDPKVALEIDSLKSSFNTKAQALVEREVKKAAEEYMKKLMGGGEQKAAANKKVEEAKDKTKEAVKDPENQRKAKEALKGLFGK